MEDFFNTFHLKLQYLAYITLIYELPKKKEKNFDLWKYPNTLNKE